MFELTKEVARLVAEEYGRAAGAQGAAAQSPHEGYALIKEEVEEAQVEMETLSQRLDHLWDSIKGNEDQYGPHYLAYIKKAAVLGACELIQVAAMAEKALLGYEIMKEEHKNEKTAESDGKG